ncbi:MAG: sensor domain-containing diguanylate cyclase [Vicinamibacteria bacterium]|nr:sensor domain-containing diguanylate cyclase [Vicinamibacteria bacterium]
MSSRRAERVPAGSVPGYGPVWWSLGELRSISRDRRLVGVLVLWLLSIVASIVTGALNVTRGWTGLPFTIASIEFAATVYPPFIISVLLALWLGPVWGAVPIYLANVASGLASGLSLPMSAIFAFGGVTETLVLWGSLVVLRVDPDIRRLRDLFWSTAAALVASVTGSLAAILWNASHGLDPLSAQRVWRGWVIGDFMQILFVVLPVLHFAGPGIRAWFDRRFVAPPQREFSYTHGVGLIVVAFALLGLVVFLGVHQALGSIELAIDTRTVDGDLLIPKLREIILMMALLSTALTAATGMFSTALARMGERQRSEARRDTLTGCLNRRTFSDILHHEGDRGRRLGVGLGVLFVDLDHFKGVNDRLGHAVGDQVLVAVVGRMEGALRSTDLLFRWGGEEFVILMPHTKPAEIDLVAERLRAAVADSPLLPDVVAGGVRSTVSVGVATADSQTGDHSGVLDRADKACLRAKSEGRNRVVMA